MMKNFISIDVTHFPKIVACLLIAVTIVGCDRGTSPDPLPESPNNKMAYVLAAALDNPEVRETVHSAMDASPHREHKLVFQEFIESSEGTKLREELTSQLEGEKKLDELLDKLPRMDFYLPYETHRETWEHANGNIMAICILDVDAKKAKAYHPDGSSQMLTSKEEVHASEVAALFTLHPAEKKILRGDSEVKTPIATQSDRWKTRVYRIYNWTTDGYFGGDCEIYFKTSDSDGNSRSSKIVHVPRRGGSGTNLPGHAGNKLVSPAVWIYPDAASESNELTVTTMEADGGFGNGGDDNYGTFTVTKSGKYDTSKKTEQPLEGSLYPKARVFVNVK
ncbi:hypothetical protein [Fodinibius halophilus]|uniref:DUF4848 domain-containing protein n=1 Tax=Fodinibius halophilus TaxID=1736908 RepID=A0A6M1T6D7_9BACT|nr:hypothetical protein [Fodinibius halophilus]NGP89649.1 hypothetical protein [Fodinibius halophilus]